MKGMKVINGCFCIRLFAISALLGNTIAFSPSTIGYLQEHATLASCNRNPRKITHLNASVSPSVNIALISSSIAILSGYHIDLFRAEKNSNTKTWRQYQADTREDWARHVRETEGWLYAIQSMRNAMVAQQFLATTVLSQG